MSNGIEQLLCIWGGGSLYMCAGNRTTLKDGHTVFVGLEQSATFGINSRIDKFRFSEEQAHVYSVVVGPVQY